MGKIILRSTISEPVAIGSYDDDDDDREGSQFCVSLKGSSSSMTERRSIKEYLNTMGLV